MQSFYDRSNARSYNPPLQSRIIYEPLYYVSKSLNLVNRHASWLITGASFAPFCHRIAFPESRSEA